MSMEIYLLSDRWPASMQTWQHAIDGMGLPLRLSTATPFAMLRGALPAALRDRPVAFECDHWDAAALMAAMPDVAFGQPWRYALAFRWGGDFDAGASAYLAAAALARATDGRILDCSEGKLISAERAVQAAAEMERSGPLIEAAVRQMMERMRK
jgi:hypothetical protein